MAMPGPCHVDWTMVSCPGDVMWRSANGNVQSDCRFYGDVSPDVWPGVGVGGGGG